MNDLSFFHSLNSIAPMNMSIFYFASAATVEQPEEPTSRIKPRTPFELRQRYIARVGVPMPSHYEELKVSDGTFASRFCSDFADSNDYCTILRPDSSRQACSSNSSDVAFPMLICYISLYLLKQVVRS
jgi:hypothetical protein